MTIVLHHRHTRPVLIRDWSRPMDGITTNHLGKPNDHPPRRALARRNREVRNKPRVAVAGQPSP